MPDAALDGLLRFAITHKRLIQFRYSEALRVAEPHDYGVQKGRVRLFVYQLRALGSAANTAEGWRLLDVAKVSELEVLADTFPGSRGRAYRQHHEWDSVYARVK